MPRGFSFAAGNRPIAFSSDVTLLYDPRTSMLTATCFTEGGQSENLLFQQGDTTVDTLDLKGMNKEQFLMMCGMMCALAIHQDLWYLSANTDEGILVTFHRSRQGTPHS
ncbi:hypothetical protein KW782_00955 [Candidatus Parcubacteria bacterium]|nr:hypothetical protein [Candidatus Parcubacteria bacterium]